MTFTRGFSAATWYLQRWADAESTSLESRSGTDDKATRPSGSVQFHENVGSTDKTLKLYDGHYHDLLNDLGKEAVIADIAAWVDQRLH